MSQQQQKRIKRVLMALCVATGVVSWQWPLIDETAYHLRVRWQMEQVEQGRGGKPVTGRSLEKQTKLEQTIVASQAAAGFDGERVWSAYDDWEPNIAVRPGSSTEVWQAVTRYNGPKACNGCPFPIIVLRKSNDGGVTYGPDIKAPITKYKQNDPEIEIASDGTVYLAWMDDYTPGIRFAKSSNGGATWTTPIKITPRGGTPDWGDKPLLTMSPDGRDVYLAFNASDAFIVASHDYGVTWGAPIKTNNDGRYWFHTGGAVAPNGHVYFITADFSQDYLGDANIKVLKSSDGGLSWNTTQLDTTREMPDCPWAEGCYKGFFGTMAGISVDGNGTVMAAYNANNSPNAPMQLYMRKSDNGGASWSARSEISGAGAAFNHHSVAVAGQGNGSFVVMWQDDRYGINSAYNAFARRTNNGGSTWGTVIRLSDASSGAPYKSTAGHQFPYGDYLGLALGADGKLHAIWGEGLSFTGPGGVWYTRGQ